jgi:hypothetical protein
MPDDICPELYPLFARNGTLPISAIDRSPGSWFVFVTTLLGDSGFGNTSYEMAGEAYRQRLISLFSDQNYSGLRSS